MTAAVESDSVAEFVDALPAGVKNRFRPAVNELRYLIDQEAVPRGWTVKQLADECSVRLQGTVNAPGVLMSRLREFARQAPPEPTGPVKFVQPLAHCGAEGCDPGTRWLTDLDTGRLIGRCPTCWTEPK